MMYLNNDKKLMYIDGISPLYVSRKTCLGKKSIFFPFYAYIGNINVESHKYLNKTWHAL